MLRILVYVNNEKIDELRIHNTGKQNENGECLYRIKKPIQWKDIVVWHKREHPWFYLISKIVGEL